MIKFSRNKLLYDIVRLLCKIVNFIFPSSKGSLSSPNDSPKKLAPRSEFFSFVPKAQHRLPEGQHRFERSENITRRKAAQMNDAKALPQMMLRQRRK